jgi:predicted DNA binding CopG/RHH family protein
MFSVLKTFEIPMVKLKIIVMRQEKLNGRPPKEQHKKRSYQVNVKLMTEEYYYLKSQASKAAMPINDYVRSAIRSKEVRQRLIPELNLHIRELCGMANNINQLAKKANQAGFTTVSLECSVFMEMIDDIIQRIKDDGKNNMWG